MQSGIAEAGAAWVRIPTSTDKPLQIQHASGLICNPLQQRAPVTIAAIEINVLKFPANRPKFAFFIFMAVKVNQPLFGVR